MLTTMRKLSQGFVAKILLFMMVASFALWGIGDMVNSQSRQMVVQVGAETIDDYSYAKELHRLKGSLGEYFTVELVQQLGLLPMTLENLVRDSLVAQEAEALHLRVSDEMVKNILAQDKQFHNEKELFDREIFQRRIQQMGLSEQEFLDRLRRSIQHNIIQDTIIPYAVVPAQLTTRVTEMETQQRQVLAFTFDTSALAATTPTEDEGDVRRFYEQHKERYYAPEYRRFEYVMLHREQVSKSVKIPEESLSAAYIAYAKRTKVPEKRKVSQLFYTSKEQVEHAYAMVRKGL